MTPKSTKNKTENGSNEIANGCTTLKAVFPKILGHNDVFFHPDYVRIKNSIQKEFLIILDLEQSGKSGQEENGKMAI